MSVKPYLVEHEDSSPFLFVNRILEIHQKLSKSVRSKTVPMFIAYDPIYINVGFPIRIIVIDLKNIIEEAMK